MKLTERGAPLGLITVKRYSKHDKFSVLHYTVAQTKIMNVFKCLRSMTCRGNEVAVTFNWLTQCVTSVVQIGPRKSFKICSERK